MATLRYIDWVITTPIMLITSVVYYRYEQLQNDETEEKLKEMSVWSFISAPENRNTITTILLAFPKLRNILEYLQFYLLFGVYMVRLIL
jgi:hypothetical protein